MFTGIVETVGKVICVEKHDENLTFSIQSEISRFLKIDQSVSHNGVCLTVIEADDKQHKVTAIKQTLLMSNLANLLPNQQVNLERCMAANGRIDGHIVQGHVDTTAVCTDIKNDDGSWRFTFEIDQMQQNILVDKGSICVNGVSLTVSNTQSNFFEVCIIPYTFENTAFNTLKIGDKVNIEFDILGKYFVKWMQQNNFQQGLK